MVAEARRVLVVDDDPMILSVVSEALSDEGFAVVRANNGAEALEQVRLSLPDLVVLDLMMPVMDGWAFMELCQADAALLNMPIVVLSAARSLNDVAERPGVRACLSKPFDLDDLIAVVTEHSGRV